MKFLSNKIGASGRTRTDTHFIAADFESAVYTNFTTEAIKKQIITACVDPH